jgi:hypothetical protein
MKYCSSAVIGDILMLITLIIRVMKYVRHLMWLGWCGSSNGKIPYLHTSVFHDMWASNKSFRLLTA